MTSKELEELTVQAVSIKDPKKVHSDWCKMYELIRFAVLQGRKEGLEEARKAVTLVITNL
jgi:hypothetical protein